MTAPLTAHDLAAIRQRVWRSAGTPAVVADDRRVLLAEVDRLRAIIGSSEDEWPRLRELMRLAEEPS